MAETYNWSSFYDALCRHGPDLLTGIDDDLREIIADVAATTDMFWSDGLQEQLAEGAANGNLRAGVMAAINLWRENVLETLDADFSFELNWHRVTIDAASPLVDKLVEAATPA
jgi:hypothetical protein